MKGLGVHNSRGGPKAMGTQNTDKRIEGIEMRRHMRMLPICLAAVVALILGVAAPEVWAIPFAKTAIFFEFNSTDLDLGIQIFFDAAGWQEVEVTGPDGTIFAVTNGGNLQAIGSTEVFTESAEPGLDPADVAGSIAAFQALFPEGQYTFTGTTVDGDSLMSKAKLTHELPGAPVVDLSDFPIIRWDPVPGVDGYQAIFEYVARGGSGVFVFSVDLPAAATEVSVPPEFFAFLPACGDSKVEVLAIADGNKTITEEEVDCPS